MIKYGRLYAGLAIGFGVWALTYRHLTLRMDNVMWCEDCYSYATVLHLKEMLVGAVPATLAMLATTKIMSILDKKRRK